MSVIQSIRDKGAWIIFGIIALALIAFILQDGVGRGRGAAFSTASVIGKVNGEKILRGEFEEKLQMQERMYAGQGATREQLVASVWNQEVEKAVLSQQYEKLGLQVTPKELGDILYGPNSPLRQEFTDPKTGEFMVNNARQAIAQLKKSTNSEQLKAINAAYIEPSIQKALREKYQNLLIQGNYLPKWMLSKLEADNNTMGSFSYVFVPYQTVGDSTVKVSDDEINTYVSKHSKQFKKAEETRNISYVTFSSAPSAADSAAVLNQVRSVKSGFEATTDAEAFLTKEGSELPFYNGFFSKSRMQQANKDTLVKIPVGQVYGPYFDGGSYVLAKMIAAKQWPDSAKVRHILIGTINPQTNQPIREDSVARKLADSIQTAIARGANFDSLAAKYSDDGNKDKGGVYDYFPQGQMVAPFNDFSFDKPVGSKGVVKTDFGYHYTEVLGQKNVGPVYKIAYYAKTISPSAETISAANNAAAQFSAASKNAKDFNANALKAGKSIIPGNELKQNDAMLPGLGMNRALIRWVFEGGVGDVSEPMEVGDQYVVAIVTAVHKAGLASAAEARPMVEPILRNEKKAKIIIESKFKGNTLEAFATSSGSLVQRMDSLSFSAPFLTGIGSEPKVAGAVFNKSLVNKASSPIAGNNGVFAIRTETVGAKASGMDPESFRQNLLQGTRMISYRGLEALRRAADIKDNRAKYY
ncbi:peptidylprolyl isomerase [Sediminibacterium soli]|uniref:peptidylprolyl isomerase n=1 Tax=Sediminibacterium soli TaxID=2698829 RepID=UPI00137B1999|nr:SurA N-terminal domain-containing protein [Sediminibacterium soli]NCI47895.1 peptidylprolyl isomerase [Sediminibacterium soli]